MGLCRSALLVQLYLRIERPDLARNVVKIMKIKDEDSVLVTLSNAWINLSPVRLCRLIYLQFCICSCFLTILYKLYFMFREQIRLRKLRMLSKSLLTSTDLLLCCKTVLLWLRCSKVCSKKQRHISTRLWNMWESMCMHGYIPLPYFKLLFVKFSHLVCIYFLVSDGSRCSRQFNRCRSAFESTPWSCCSIFDVSWCFSSFPCSWLYILCTHPHRQLQVKDPNHALIQSLKLFNSAYDRVSTTLA